MCVCACVCACERERGNGIASFHVLPTTSFMGFLPSLPASHLRVLAYCLYYTGNQQISVPTLPMSIASMFCTVGLVTRKGMCPVPDHF